jgi:hypothetical protein
VLKLPQWGMRAISPPLVSGILSTALVECMPARFNFSNFDTALHYFVDRIIYLSQDLPAHCLKTKLFSVYDICCKKMKTALPGSAVTMEPSTTY